MRPKILFILKKRYIPYGDPANDLPYAYQMSSGLLNSAMFVCNMLIRSNFDAKLVEVVDNNDIDREVTLYRPTHVIIEAYWVVPEKFEVLTARHPTVKWIIRGHSEIPFLANEGIAMDWTQRYIEYPNVIVASNSTQVVDDFRKWLSIRFPSRNKRDIEKSIIYLPNYYPITLHKTPFRLDDKDTIDVGCFGAVRPMKNHLIQAFAAVQLAQSLNKKLRFHINASRREGGGDKPLKNVRAYFRDLGVDYQLVEHDWMSHVDFKRLVSTMDIGMQVSFSETFNIVTADFVDMDVPVVVSDEIKWMPHWFKADMTETQQIVNKMLFALAWKKYLPWLNVNKKALHKYVEKSADVWVQYFKPQHHFHAWAE
jgi:hypothetical protein